MSNRAPVVVIGAGLSGLCAARALVRAGLDVIVFEASDGVGGRVRTDEYNGFQLDRGFQVLLSAYPTASAELDYSALSLKHYEPGAMVWLGDRLTTVSDPLRRPSRLLSSAFSPVGSISDKLKILGWRREVLAHTPEYWFDQPEQSARSALLERGFSPSMMERFLKPFYGGVFLEPNLDTSSRMLNYTFSMFTRGTAAVPERGMQAIPDQLAADLPSGVVRLRAPVVALDGTTVRLKSGEVQEASAILIATEGDVAAKLLGRAETPVRWKSSTCLYFEAKSPPPVNGYLVLNGSGRGPVNNLSVPSNLSPRLAPPGCSLISATVLDQHSDLPDTALFETARDQLRDWFGAEVDAWTPLQAVRVARSLPVAESGVRAPAVEALGQNLWMCGDHVALPSIEGAMASGLRAAEAIMDSRLSVPPETGSTPPTSYSVH